MPIKIAIDFGGWFRQNQGLKSKKQQVHPIGGHPRSAQQAALRVPPKFCRGNAAIPCFRGNLVEPRVEIRCAAPYRPFGAPFTYKYPLCAPKNEISRE